MMRLIGKMTTGFVFTETFDGVNDFLSMQQSDYNAMADDIEVLELIIDDEPHAFQGNLGQLYDELMNI